MIDDNIWLTFDMEWANDVVLDYFYSLLKKYDVKATIFVTHYTKWLDTFQRDSKIELGIHPNFNKLLMGEMRGSYQEVIENLLELVPEAISYRSHSLVASTQIISYCVKKGLQYDLNMYVHPERGMKLLPYNRSGITMIPFIFEDDLWMLDSEREKISYYLSDEFEAPRVFNFHPIHIYLNSESYDRYLTAKVYNHVPEKLAEYRNQSGIEGIESTLIELIELAKSKGLKFGLIKELAAEEGKALCH